VRVGSLSCTLQLGQAAPAQTGLSLLVVDDPRTWDASGVYGPGLLSVGLPAPQTLGTADRTEFSTGNELDTHYDLIGDIAIGGTVFTGRASGQHSHWGGDPAPPFTLSGASPAGDLSAVCTEGEPVTAPWPADVALRELACTGQVGSGPPGTVTLLLALPVSTPRYGNPCGRCSTNDGTGVFIAG
jgi:hypothetical protein